MTTGLTEEDKLLCGKASFDAILIVNHARTKTLGVVPMDAAHVAMVTLFLSSLSVSLLGINSERIEPLFKVGVALGAAVGLSGTWLFMTVVLHAA